MSSGIKLLNSFANRINSFGDKQLNNKISEWRQHYDGTEKYQGRTKQVAASQR